MDLQLRVDLLDVKTDRVDGDPQFGGSRLVVVTVDKQLEESDLVGSQIVVALVKRAVAPEEFQDASSYHRRHWRAAFEGLANGFEKPRRRGSFQQVAAGAGADGLKDAIVIVI